jgi:predicted nuclease of predicted toxin-antitoxin system
MGVAASVVDWLRAQGHDATHLGEEKLHRLPDPDVFRKAAAERRILLTFDLDFGEIVALTGEKKVSVLLFRVHDTRSPHVIERLSSALRQTQQALGSGAIVVVEESRARVRRLPVHG